MAAAARIPVHTGIRARTPVALHITITEALLRRPPSRLERMQYADRDPMGAVDVSARLLRDHEAIQRFAATETVRSGLCSR